MAAAPDRGREVAGTRAPLREGGAPASKGASATGAGTSASPKGTPASPKGASASGKGASPSKGSAQVGAAHAGDRRDPPQGPRWPLHVSPWVHYATLLGIGAALVLARRVPLLRDHVVDPYVWDPIVHDQGFNPLNTLLFIVLLLLGVLWWYRLLHHYPIRLDWPTVWSGLLVFFWGIVLRVFHDARLIAPFDADTACIPADGILMGCAGVFFVTPILWVIVGSLLFPFGRLGIAAQQVAGRRGLRAGLLVYAAGPAAIAVATWLLLLQPWTRAPPDAWWVGACALAGVAAYAERARRVGLRWSEAMLGQVLVLVAVLLQPLARLLASGVPHPSSLWAVPLAAGLAVLLAWQARRLEGTGLATGARDGPRSPHGRTAGRRTERRPRSGRNAPAVTAYVYLALLQAGAGAAALTALSAGQTMQALLWVLAAGAGIVLVRTWRRGGAAFAAWAAVPGAYILGGHLLDAFSTGIGLDLFHAEEKHVLPRTLIAALAPALEGTALAPYPGTVAMLLYKVPVALFAAWALHTHGRRLLPPDLLLILQMVVGTVGAAPGLRNALRQAMAV